MAGGNNSRTLLQLSSSLLVLLLSRTVAANAKGAPEDFPSSVDTAPTATIKSGATSISSPTSSPTHTSKSSGHHLSRINLILVIVLPIIVLLAAVVAILLFCRRRSSHRYSDITRQISGPISVVDEKPWRSPYGLAAPTRPADLGRSAHRRDIEDTHRRSVTPLSMLTSPFSASYRTGPYSHVRSGSETEETTQKVNQFPQNTAYVGGAYQANGSNPTVDGGPFSDGRASPWTIPGRTSPAPSSGRGTPERRESKQFRPRNMSQISLPLSAVEDPIRRSSTPLAWSAERIQGDGRGRTTPNPFDGRNTPDHSSRRGSQSRNVRISLPLSAVEDPATGRTSSPLAWSADRIIGDGTGRSTPNPFEITGFTPTSAMNPYGTNFDHSARHSHATILSEQDGYVLSPTRASVPCMLAPTPLPTQTTFAAAETAALQPVHEDPASRHQSLEPSYPNDEARQSELRSHTGTIRSVTTIRTSVDSDMAARLEDMPPLPATWSADQQRHF